MSTLRKDILHAIEKEHSRMVMFGDRDKEKEEMSAQLIEKMKAASADPENWMVQLYVFPKDPTLPV
jgi:hypothetical protein